MGVWGYVSLAAGVVVFLLLWWWLDPNLRRQRQYKAALAVREPLSDAAIFAQYFAVADIDPEIPAQVRRVFAAHMGYPAEKLLPDDDFAFFWAELDMAALIAELESGFGITITRTAVERTPCTIRAVSRLIAHKTGRTNRSS